MLKGSAVRAMHNRMRTLVILTATPFLFFAGVIGFLLTRDMFRSHHQDLTIYGIWMMSTWLHAVLAIGAVFIVILSEYIAGRMTEPVAIIIDQAEMFATGKSVVKPVETGDVSIDTPLTVLHQTFQDAQRRIEAERTLAADVSHQLRSPLTALTLRLEEIVQSAKGTKSEAEAVAALTQVERLVGLVENLLNSWRLNKDRQLSSVVVIDLLDPVLDQWRPRFAAQSRHIEVSGMVEAQVMATLGVQEQVLSVLLENSLRHGAGITTIEVKDYRSWILIEVGDEGEGIAEDLRTTVMDQGTSTSGTGLGLSWARNQVAADGGRLELRRMKPAVFGIFLIADASADPHEFKVTRT